MGPIGSVVLTFIGYKQTDKQSIYIDDMFTSIFKGVRLPPEDDIILRKDAYQSLARVREIQRVAAGIFSTLKT